MRPVVKHHKLCNQGLHIHSVVPIFHADVASNQQYTPHGHLSVFASSDVKLGTIGDQISDLLNRWFDLQKCLLLHRLPWQLPTASHSTVIHSFIAKERLNFHFTVHRVKLGSVDLVGPLGSTWWCSQPHGAKPGHHIQLCGLSWRFDVKTSQATDPSFL